VRGLGKRTGRREELEKKEKKGERGSAEKRRERSVANKALREKPARAE
jgi:hypothetical protein